jgi:DNA-binding GntR family transcriptional regulator
MQVLIETGLAERDRMVHGTAGPRDPVPSHRAVVTAIRRSDPAGAARAMGKLLDQAIEDVAELEKKAGSEKKAGREKRGWHEDRQD